MEILVKGGPIMYFILVCSIFMAAIFINRIIYLHRMQIDTREFISGLRNELKARRVTEAISICEHTPGPIARIIKAGIINHDRGAVNIRNAMDRVALQEIPRLERGVSLLVTIAVVTPLLGLLGTVLGLINVFQLVGSQAGMLTGSQLAGGLWEALLTTAFGLAVAIPAYLAYNYLVVRIQNMVQEMDQSAAELVEVLSEEDLAGVR